MMKDIRKLEEIIEESRFNKYFVIFLGFLHISAALIFSSNGLVIALLIGSLFVSPLTVFFLKRRTDNKIKCNVCGNNKLQNITRDETLEITRAYSPTFFGYPILRYCEKCNIYWQVGHNDGEIWQ